MSAPIPVGPFDLLAPLGEGGMGVVYRGVHRALGIPVAAKVLGVDHGDAFNLTSFRNEVRLVAGLDHPGIVRVHDHRRLDEAAAAASEGALRAGSPCLVMELVEGGDLHRLCGTLPWAEVRAVLLALLEGLSHAHARDVLHLDLKPGNVLRSVDGVVKLTDFGLGLAIDHSNHAGRAIAGTPAYMAPEQVRGAWRDFGPWTDLYAVGCLTYSLVAGRPPFAKQSTSPGELMDAQLNRRPDPLPEEVDAPEGLAQWMAVLLAKAPGERFQRAADAAAALSALPAENDPPAQRRTTEERARPPATVTAELTQTLDDVPGADVWAVIAATAPSFDPPALPADWRRAEVARPATPQDAGLGLFELRTAPFVGRDAERAALWKALGEVHAWRRPRFVSLRGPSGCGKSRLARWLCERAHETGGATIMNARHGPSLGVGHGLGPMAARLLRADGLEQGELLAHLARRLSALGLVDPDDRAAIAELVAPTPVDAPAPGAVRLRSPRERHAELTRLVRAVANERPVVIWLDDVQWGADALAFAAHLFDETAALPVLLLATAQLEALAERPTEAAALGALLERPEASTLELEALPGADTRALLAGLLPLTPRLLDAVVERVRGNALFAVQLVGDWVERGLFRAGADGFDLGADTPGLPDDLHAVWRDRLARALRRRPADDRQRLEVAAALGQTVGHAEWAAACAARGLAASPPELPARSADDGLEAAAGQTVGDADREASSPDLLERLLDQRLAVRDGRGQDRWSWVHGMLRESVLREAEEAGRLAAHHHACATALVGVAHPERIADHLLAAGEVDEALEPLIDAGQARFFEGEYARADQVLDKLDAALADAGVPPSDVRHGQGWVLRAEVALRSGRVEDALEWARRAAESGKTHDWGEPRVRALELRGRLAGLQGRPEDARRDFEAGVRLAAAHDAPVAGARCQRALGLIVLERGEIGEALSWLDRAQAAFDAHGVTRELASCSLILGRAAMSAQRLDDAERHYRRAREAYQREGSRWGAAEALCESGDVHRYRGDLDRAIDCYSQAIERLTLLDSTDAFFGRINLGIGLLEKGAPSEARAHIEAGMTGLAARGVHLGDAHGHLALSVCAAMAGEWARFDRHFDEAAARLTETDYVHPDLARLAELAQRWAMAAGETDRSARAAALALEQRRRLKG